MLKTEQPANITATDLSEWKLQHEIDQVEQAEVYAENEKTLSALQLLFPGFQPPDPLELWYCSKWFEREVKAIGGTEKEIAQVCFAHGQKLAACVNGDLWGVSVQALEQYRSGTWDRPTDELSMRLCQHQIPMLIAIHGAPKPEAVKAVREKMAEMGKLGFPPLPEHLR